MPVGNGEVGINLWVEEAGGDTDILFYISRTDAWDENGRLCKLGRVRLRLNVPPHPFQQTLDLARGSIELRCGPATLSVWVDAHAPVIRIDGHSSEPVQLRASVELWRTAPRTVTLKKEEHSFAGQDITREPIVILLDTVIPGQLNRVAWCHRNTASCWAKTLTVQELESLIPQFNDPLMHRTFGAVLSGEGLVTVDDLTLATQKPRRRFSLTVHTHTAQTETVEEWFGELLQIPQGRARRPAEPGEVHQDSGAADRSAHDAWWQEFWQRSWIHITGSEEAETVTCGYTLQRFINACSGCGALPVKFNGSLFTVDAREPDEHFDPDYRRWGGCYWFQNTRLIYWSMLASGDFDMIQPWYGMFRDAFPLAEARVRHYYGHGGVLFPETMQFWGAYRNDDYGYDRAGKELGLTDNAYIRRYWQGMLELLAELPPLPQRREVWTQKRYLIPALQYDVNSNWENPELYAIFPYRLYGVSKPDLEVGRETFERRTNRQTGGWSQDVIQAALLGLTEEARRGVVKNFSTSHPGSRFPAFWGPNFDWIPDQDHGCAAMHALQKMLLQSDDGKIFLCPAWPKDWTVHFKLHAQNQTTIEAKVENGQIELLNVTPSLRQKDIQ